jgi:Na+/melibiose symporter-like transporter
VNLFFAAGAAIGALVLLAPLRVVLDRNRAGAYLAVALTFVAGFAMFLFLTYFLQDVRGFPAVRTGVAFLPFPIDRVLASTIANVKLLPRLGPRLLIIAGFVLSAAGFVLLAVLVVLPAALGLGGCRACRGGDGVCGLSQISTWPLTRFSRRWKTGRRSRSSDLMCRKSRSTYLRFLYAVTVSAAPSPAAGSGVRMT